MQYCHDLAVRGGALLANAWGTDVLFDDPTRYGAMVDVRVPTRNSTLAGLLPLQLLTRFGTWCVTRHYGLQHVVRCTAGRSVIDVKSHGLPCLQVLPCAT